MASKITFRVVKKEINDKVEDCVEYLRVSNEMIGFKFPENLQPKEFHTELLKQRIIGYATNSMDNVGDFRNITVTATKNLINTYWDKDGNTVFLEHVLEEIRFDDETSAPTAAVAVKSDPKTFLSGIEHNFSIGKFEKAHDAADWFQDFEDECSRFGITSDEMKTRALKHFVRDSSEDWYKACQTQFLVEDFASWKESFLKAFGHRGWSKIEYALGFKYLAGSYADYAMKKLRLLLEVERNMTVDSRINLIVFGLPPNVRRCIDKKNVKDVESLMNELSVIEPSVKFVQPQAKFRDSRDPNKMILPRDASKETTWSGEKKPCAICESLNLRNRFHSSERCWNRQRKNNLERRVNLNEECSEGDRHQESEQKN